MSLFFFFCFPPVEYFTLSVCDSVRSKLIISCPPDDPELFDGLPVGLQLIGRTLEEEGVIAMTEVVVTALEASQRR